MGMQHAMTKATDKPRRPKGRDERAEEIIEQAIGSVRYTADDLGLLNANCAWRWDECPQGEDPCREDRRPLSLGRRRQLRDELEVLQREIDRFIREVL